MEVLYISSEACIVSFVVVELLNLQCCLNHDVQKIDFANNLQLSLTLTAMSIGLWWLFDRSRSGFGLGISIAVIATIISQLLVYNGIYRYGLS